VRSPEGPVTRPAVVFQFCERDNARPDGVEVDVVQLSSCQWANRIVIGAETGLEDVAEGSPEDLMLIGEGGLQRMHPLAEVAKRGGHHQVEMVCHDGIGMDLPGEAHRDGQDDFQEDLLGLVGFEDGCPRLRPIVGMVGALVGDEPSAIR